MKKSEKEKIVESTKKVKGFVEEFKKFISRGNVVDLAVGVVVGTAFSKIVTSMVDDIIMPIVGILIGGRDFSHLTLTIGEASIKYGAFIQNIVNFLIIALFVFLFVKAFNNFFKKKEAEPVKPKESPKAPDVVLLEEIRDLLKDSKKKKTQ